MFSCSLALCVHLFWKGAQLLLFDYTAFMSAISWYIQGIWNGGPFLQENVQLKSGTCILLLKCELEYADWEMEDCLVELVFIMWLVYMSIISWYGLIYIMRWIDTFMIDVLIWNLGGKAEFVDGMSLSHGFNLVSACGYPRYTNYVGGYTGCLDYIYVESERLQTLNVVPMPSHEDVTEHTALPNAVFPSDHIALVCELGWTKEWN